MVIGSAELRLLGEARWLAPLLAEMSVRQGARFAELLNALGLPRESLVRTLEQAVGMGWIVRNAGHGHPLRPEYLLTAAGEGIAAIAARIMATRRRLGLAPRALTRWSLPVVGRLDRVGWTRFSDLRDELSPVTPRALSQTLKQMAAVDLVDRRVEEGFPPQTRYGLTSRGHDLAGAFAA